MIQLRCLPMPKYLPMPDEDPKNLRDESFWLSLMTLGLDHQSAAEVFRISTNDGNLIACNPRGPHLKPIRVTFDVERDADHILFKGSDDTHGRENPMSGHPEDFQQERADRIGWIAEVLLRPEAIYEEIRKPRSYAYLCRTLPNEQFLVVIFEVTLPRSHYFITAFRIEEGDWIRKRRGYRKHFPHKSKKKDK